VPTALLVHLFCYNRSLFFHFFIFFSFFSHVSEQFFFSNYLLVFFGHLFEIKFNEIKRLNAFSSLLPFV